MAAILVWSAAELAQWATADATAQRLLVGLCLTCSTVGVLGTGAWVAVVTGWNRVVHPAAMAAAAAPGVIACLVLWAGDPGDLVVATTPAHGMRAPGMSPGPLAVVQSLWAYVAAAAVLVAVLWLGAAIPRRVRRWVLALAVSLVVPVVVNALWVSGVASVDDHDPTIAGFAVVMAVLLAARPRLAEVTAGTGLVPVARSEVVDAMSEGVVVLDGRGRVLDVNPAGLRLLGMDPSGLRRGVAASLIPGMEGAGPDTTWEFTAPDTDPPRTIEARAERLQRGRSAAGTLILLRDITRQRSAQAALERSVAQHVHASRHDPLTGLPNRVLLFSGLRAALGPGGGGCTLFILDLNGFKGLNDTFGHRAGDRVLRDLAARLESTVGADAMVARLAGDEFAVLAPGTERADASAAAERILGAFQMPFRVADTDVMIGASVGSAIGPVHGADVDDLVHAADVAMYHAKRTAGRWALYEPGLDARRPEQLMLRHELRRAIEADELVIYYQPLARADGQVKAVEALVRWRHPARGLLTPDQFLPVIEDSDLICRLTDTVLDKAIAQMRGWTARGVRVAVNLSALDLRDPALPARVAGALERHVVPPEILTLEITENALSGTRESTQRIADLRERGVRVALDDFGTGIGPLSSLRDLAVDEIKIDRSFVSAMAASPRDSALVGGLIRLGHDLGLAVVAEGVESARERTMLGDMGCDLLQGYLIGHPAPPEEVAAALFGGSAGSMPAAR